jgi:hypothetical protein
LHCQGSDCADDFQRVSVYDYGVQRWIFVAMLFLPGVPLFAQESSTASGTQTYTSPDGRFQLSYPDWFTRCSYQNDSWGSCTSYMPMCGAVWQTEPDTPICVAYPPDKVPAESNFLGAAFSVSEINGVTSQADCEAFAPNPAGVGAKQRVKEINGQKFTWISMGGAAMGHYQDARAYRTFHGDRCFELDVVLNYRSGTGYDEVPLKQFDSAPVKKLLGDTLESFRFVK